MLRMAATNTCAQAVAFGIMTLRRCAATTITKVSAPRPRLTVRMLNTGISLSATRIAGQVSPHARLSSKSISFAVVSAAWCGAGCTPASGGDAWKSQRIVGRWFYRGTRVPQCRVRRMPAILEFFETRS